MSEEDSHPDSEFEKRFGDALLACFNYARSLDVKKFIADFAKLESYKLDVFTAHWKNTRFGLIHRGRPEHDKENLWLRGVLDDVSDFFTPNVSLYLRVGALYAVFLLYETQPIEEDVCVARAQYGIDIWRHIIDLYRRIIEEKLADAYQVYVRLRSCGAFELHVVRPLHPLCWNLLLAARMRECIGPKKLTQDGDELPADLINELHEHDIREAFNFSVLQGRVLAYAHAKQPLPNESGIVLDLVPDSLAQTQASEFVEFQAKIAGLGDGVHESNVGLGQTTHSLTTASSSSSRKRGRPTSVSNISVEEAATPG